MTWASAAGAGRSPPRRAYPPTPRGTTTPASCFSSITERPRLTCTTESSTRVTGWCTTCRSTCPRRGLYASRFHPDIPSRLGVIPRRGGTGDIRWFETRLHRWRMNLLTGQTREEDLSETCTEFGTINSGFGGRPYPYNYAATNEPSWFLFRGLVKHDPLTGREEQYQFSPGVFCSEVGVAPGVGGTDEDDAYLVTRERSCPSGSLVARTAAGRRASPSKGGSRPA